MMSRDDESMAKRSGNLAQALERSIREQFGSFMGPGLLWGENPHDNPPTGQGQHYPPLPFKADYIALLYVGLQLDGTFRINHASYPLPGTDADARRDKAIAIFKDLVYVNGRRFSDLAVIHPPYRRSNNEYDSVEFENFRFKSPTEVFIYLHQPVPRTTLDITLDPQMLLSFAMSAQERDPVTHRRKYAEPNTSFFNARPVSSAEMGSLYDYGNMIRVENWATGPYGDPIAEYNRLYSMNIHYTLPGNLVPHTGLRLQIPMIFDPDTGNGVGNEP